MRRPSSTWLTVAAVLAVIVIVTGTGIFVWTQGGHGDPAQTPTSSSHGVEAGIVALDPALLEPQTDDDARRLIAFTQSATPRDRATLRDMALQSSNPLVVGNAIRGLGRLGAVAEDNALLALLHDPRARVRQELVVALGASGDRRMVARLIEMLQPHETDGGHLRPLVLQALGRIGGPKAQEALAQIAGDSNAAEIDQVFARQALSLQGQPDGASP